MQHVTCDLVEADGVEAILQVWWRHTTGELLDRLRGSAKPSARKYAVAVARVLVCLKEAERQLVALRQGMDAFAGDEYLDPAPEDRLSLESGPTCRCGILSS